MRIILQTTTPHHLQTAAAFYKHQQSTTGIHHYLYQERRQRHSATSPPNFNICHRTITHSLHRSTTDHHQRLRTSPLLPSFINIKITTACSTNSQFNSNGGQRSLAHQPTPTSAEEALE